MGSQDGDLWINDTYVSETVITLGSYDNYVFLHELGHAMGLAHPGDYNASSGVSLAYKNSAQFKQDSGQFQDVDIAADHRIGRADSDSPVLGQAEDEVA